MSGAIPPLPYTSSWRGAQLKYRDFTFHLLFQNKVAGATTPAGTGKASNIYGHMVVGEESEDSENSSVYHEPYKLLPSAKQEYGCLLKKDTLSSSKSGEYTGE
jgi:hypothetical protein